MEIEQAIFTSLANRHGAGYQLAAASPGVREVDARRLAVWGPSHDSLWDGRSGAASINFHPLPSGVFCISRTTATGTEFSGRGGANVYTHCLIVTAEVLARFGNNPFALLTAASAKGFVEARQAVPERLTASRLPGRSTGFESELLRRIAAEPGASQFASFLTAALKQPRLALFAGVKSELLIRGLFCCLPPACRIAFSFSTGLRYSPRRPFRLVGLPEEKSTPGCRIPDRHGLHAWCLVEERKPLAPREGWPRFIHDVLESGRYEFLKQRLNEKHNGLEIANLPHLAERLREQMHAACPTSSAPRAATPPGMATLGELTLQLRSEPFSGAVWDRWQATHGASLDSQNTDLAAEIVFRACQVFGAQSGSPDELRRRIADLLERQFGHDPLLFRHTRERLSTLKAVFGRDRWLALAAEVESRCPRIEAPREANPSVCRRYDGAPIASTSRSVSGTASRLEEPPSPSETLARKTPDALGQLELLDDTVFEAIAGKRQALDRLRTLWPQTLSMLGPEAVDESKEQYVRHALTVWHDCVEGETIRTPELAVAVMDVMTILLGENAQRICRTGPSSPPCA